MADEEPPQEEVAAPPPSGAFVFSNGARYGTSPPSDAPTSAPPLLQVLEGIRGCRIEEGQQNYIQVGSLLLAWQQSPMESFITCKRMGCIIFDRLAACCSRGSRARWNSVTRRNCRILVKTGNLLLAWQ